MAYKRPTPEEMEKRKAELFSKVDNIINNFKQNPADILEYLKFNSKFHQYSENNTMLIYEQNSMARYCASYKSFQDMGYQVQKGQIGMKIMVPHITTYFFNPDTQQWKKVSEGTKEQQARVKSGELQSKQHRGFHIGTVFEIGQTDCPVDDYPKIFNVGYPDAEHNTLYNAVANFAQERNITFQEQSFPSISTRGYFDKTSNLIAISDKLRDSMKLSVATHELAHAIMHSSEEAADRPTMQKEIEADSLSLMLRENLGITDIEDARQAHLQTAYKNYIQEAELNADNGTYPDLSVILDNVSKAYVDIIEDFNASVSAYLDNQKNVHTQELTEAEQFSNTIDDFSAGKINPTEQIFVCKTTEVMKLCGANELDVMIYQDTIRKILSDDINKFEHPHNLSVDILKQLPTQLQKPIMVFKGAHKGSIVLITDIFNDNNEQIIISCQLDSKIKRHEINRITSMYGKENIANYLDAQIKKGNLIGCQKNIANKMLQSVGLYLPSEEAFIDYTHIIPNIDENVNKNNEIDYDEPLKISLNDYLAAEGLQSPISDWTTDKSVIPRGMTVQQRTQHIKNGTAAIDDYHDRRAAAIAEYNAKLESGAIVAPSRIDELIAKASGHPDNSSTQAAIRSLQKRGYSQDNNGNWINEGDVIMETGKLTIEEANKMMTNNHGNLDLRGTGIAELPNNLKVGGYLALQGTKITELPDNLEVGGYLDLRGTGITELPDNLKVNGNIFLSNREVIETSNVLNIKNIFESLIDEYNSGDITIENAALELHKAGYYNYIPSKQETLDRLTNYANKNNILPPRISKEVYVKFDGDNISIVDNNDRSIELTTERDGQDSRQQYFLDIARDNPEYSDFIHSHLQELVNDYEKAVDAWSYEANSVKLAKLEADMYAGGGYGEDQANANAINEIERLNRLLSAEHDKHFSQLNNIAEYERNLNVSPNNYLIKMNYETGEWQATENVTPEQIEALYQYLNKENALSLSQVNEIRQNHYPLPEAPLSADDYYQNLKYNAFADRFDFGDEKSINIEAIEKALTEVPLEYVLSRLTPEQCDLFADYYEGEIDFAGTVEIGLTELDKQLYDAIISIRSNTAIEASKNITKTQNSQDIEDNLLNNEGHLSGDELLKAQAAANIQMTIDKEIKAYGKPQSSTLDFIKLQGLYYADGKVLINSPEYSLKTTQFEIIAKYNPAPDSYHTWIRNPDDILSFEDALKDSDYEGWEINGFDETYTAEIAEQAKLNGSIKVFSSYPIRQGVFVTPSYAEAKSYSGTGQVYSKEVKLTDIAWIDATQGMYANIDEYEKTKESNLEAREDLIDELTKNGATPDTILYDKGQLQWYAFNSNLDEADTSELLKSIQKNEMQTVAIYENEQHEFELLNLNDDYQIERYSERLSLEYELALDDVLADDNIVKLVEYKTLLQASTERDLKPIAESENLKYPYISINSSDNATLLKQPNMLLKDAIDIIKRENVDVLVNDNVETVNLSLLTRKDMPFNIELKLGTENGELVDALNNLAGESSQDSNELKAFLKEQGLYVDESSDAELEFGEQLDFFAETELI